MKIGDRVEHRRVFSESAIQEFTTLSNGGNAQGAVPEPLIAAMFSYLLGVHLPGPGTNYLKQELNFLGRAPIDIELTASVEITRLRPEKHLVDLVAKCSLPDGSLICEGRSLVKAKDVEKVTSD